MKKVYTGSTKALESANSFGISDKAKKIITTALIAGTLNFVGSQTNAHTYTEDNVGIKSDSNATTQFNKNNYTKEQINKHQRYIKEVSLHYENMEKETKSHLKELLETNKITKEKYDNLSTILFDTIKIRKDNSVSELKNNPNNILDKNLVSMNILPKQSNDDKPRIKLNLNDISSLNLKQIESLEKNYIIDIIELNRYYEMIGSKPIDKMFKYSPETYKKLLNTIEQKFGDLKNVQNLSELEKATIVLKRMEKLTYDSGVLSLPVTEKPNPRLFTSRNLVDPLLNNTGVCAGYSDLFKNIMSYIGIEAKEIRGYVKTVDVVGTVPGEANHAWNQVKLDGKWCNVDITQIIDNKKILKPNKPHPFLFVENSELKINKTMFKSEISYLPILGLAENDTHSFSQAEIDGALNTAISYEKSNKKSNVSIVQRVIKKIKDIKTFAQNKRNKVLALGDGNSTIHSEAETTNQTNTQNKRDDFANYLSDNDKYKNVSVNITNASKTSNKEISNKRAEDSHERS